MKKQKLAWVLFWIGLLYAIAFAGIATWNLTHTFRTHTSEQVKDTIWNLDGPLFMLWAFSVPLGSLLAGIGAFLYVGTKKAFIWLTAIGVLVVVIVMTFIFSRKYYPPLFGIGGGLILLAFFAILWLWIKKYATLDIQGKIAGSFKLVGYLFLMNASWFLCGEFGAMHQKAFEGKPAPSPIEIMVYLVLGWLFIAVGDYKLMRLAKTD